MNITELARQVQLPTKQLKEVLPHLGFDIGARAIKVDTRIAQKIIQELSNKHKRKKILDKLYSENNNKETESEENNDIQTSSRELSIGSRIIVKDFARKLNIDVTKLVVGLMRQGIMASLNDYIDYDIASIVAEDYGFTTKRIHDHLQHNANTLTTEEYIKLHRELQGTLPRPPIVVVMGHVDHGKTKLLDVIRSVDTASHEHGGITQHIGAYQVEVALSKKIENIPHRKLTFIDTPGHEAFSMMRSRGARVADMAILVVAADDGVQPQTIEAISHIKKMQLPFVVAINKIDKPEANPDKIRNELSEIGLVPESWGGDTIMVEISAQEKTNIDELLETLLLVYELHKDTIVGDPDTSVFGTVIESHIDKGSGPVATLLIQSGTLRVGDNIMVGSSPGRVRIMKNWEGRTLNEALPSTPVAVLGLKYVPHVGDILKPSVSTRERKRAKKISRRQTQTLYTHVSGQATPVETEIPIVIKSDVLGSLEALQESLSKLNHHDVRITTVYQGLGSITEIDILRAVDSGAYVMGFNVTLSPEAEELSRVHGVTVKVFNIIYDFLDFLSVEMSQQLTPEAIKKEKGLLTILKIFRKDKDSTIIGAKVTKGEVVPGALLNIIRNKVVISEGYIKELQSGKEVVAHAVEGQEIGLSVVGCEDIEEGDRCVVFIKEKKERTVTL